MGVAGAWEIPEVEYCRMCCGLSECWRGEQGTGVDSQGRKGGGACCGGGWSERDRLRTRLLNVSLAVEVVCQSGGQVSRVQ